MTALAVLLLAAAAPAAPLPFGPGERITMKVTYAHLLAGRATMTVARAEHGGAEALELAQVVKSEGPFAWLFRYKVDNRLVATWDPKTGCSYGIEKRLRQGKYARDQRVTLDPAAGKATIEDKGYPPVVFNVWPCVQDVLSAFYVARVRGLPPEGVLKVPVYDAGRAYELAFRLVGRETLDLPAPLGRGVKTLMVRPEIPRGSGLFAQEGELTVWVTDDARRIPVRARTRVAVGSVSADLESYEAGEALTASPSDAASARPRSTSGTGPPTRRSPR